MDNLKAAMVLIRVYGEHTISHGTDDEAEEAIALAIGALRKVNDDK